MKPLNWDKNWREEIYPKLSQETKDNLWWQNAILAAIIEQSTTVEYEPKVLKCNYTQEMLDAIKEWRNTDAMEILNGAINED